jgi:hypothetical protein
MFTALLALLGCLNPDLAVFSVILFKVLLPVIVQKRRNVPGPTAVHSSPFVMAPE